MTNPTTFTLYGWTAGWVLADDETISNSWNGTLSVAGSLATMKRYWNNVLAPGGSATFGFTTNQASSPSIPTSISCQSP